MHTHTHTHYVLTQIIWDIILLSSLSQVKDANSIVNIYLLHIERWRGKLKEKI